MDYHTNSSRKKRRPSFVPTALPRNKKIYGDVSAKKSRPTSMPARLLQQIVHVCGKDDCRMDKTENFNLFPVFQAMSTKLSVNRPAGLRRSTLALHRMNSKLGQHQGFEDLRVFIKQGSEFSKELVQTLNERAELEANYAKGLQKLSAKLFKASKDMTGTVPNAWHFVAEDMEATAEVHKSVATIMIEEMVKPLKTFVTVQHQARKSLETLVDKRARNLGEWRAAEQKTKSKCYSSCRENERVQDQVLDCKLGRGRVLSDKELVKLNNKRKKSEDSVRKSDLDYYACCLKAERARLEWESAVFRGCHVFRRMEEDRLVQLRTLAEQYHQTMSENRPKLMACSQRLEEPVRNCDVSKDMEAVTKKVDVDMDSMGDQVLPNFYAEDPTNAMNQERRREALAKFLRVIKSDIDREKKGKAGVENLAKALHETPKFGGEDSQQDVQEKLQHMRSMLTFLEACRFKVLNSLLDMEGRPRVTHPLSTYIEADKDKNGMMRILLKIPYWARQEPQPPVEYSEPSSPKPIGSDRGTADGGFTDVRHTDFTTSIVGSGVVFGGRGKADGAGGSLQDEGSPQPDSDFDDFSDSDADIIEVVNGVPNLASSVATSTYDDMSAAKTYDDVSAAMTSTYEDVSTATTVTNGHHHHHYNGGGNLVTSDVEARNDQGNSQECEVSEIYFKPEKSHIAPSLGQCRALYDYAANMYDELSIKVGDVINVHDKQADGWWLGELNGTVGIFPATYVEETSKST